MDYLGEALFTLFVIIDPIGVVPIFMGVTRHHTLQEKRRIALRATLISLVILLSFAFIGDFVLDKLKIDESSFRIAGGILLLLSAINMVMVGHSGTIGGNAPSSADQDSDDVAVFPLAIPMIAGPGALVSVVIVMRSVEQTLSWQLAIGGLIVVVVATTYVCFLLSESILRLLGVTGTNVLTRVFGIILSAFAVQFMVDGITTTITTATKHLPNHTFLQPMSN